MSTNQLLTRVLAGLLVVSGLLFWAGCDSSGGMGETAQGDFTLRLTDAPAALDKAVVTITRVDLVTEDDGDDDDDGSDEDDGDDDNGDDDDGDDDDGDDDDGDDDDGDDDDGDDDDGDDDDGDDGDDDGGTITLTEETRQLDLLQLQNGNEELLADEITVPEGEYTQLRFVLGDKEGDNYVVVNDERQMLSVSSGEIKIILPEVEIENDGDQIDITLDFDVDESFIEQGNGDYRFKPTIKVKNVSVNGQSIETVSVDGFVTSVDAGSDMISVEEIGFTTTATTEIEGDNVSALGDIQADQYVEVEGTRLDSTTLEAREIETEDSDDERSITARIESKDEEQQSVTLLGVPVQVTSDTEFDDSSFDALESGDRVEVDYTLDSDGQRIATEIENEDD